jgi:hypothetical protein
LVEELLFKKQEELNKATKQLNFMRNAHKTVSYDLGRLRLEKDK